MLPQYNALKNMCLWPREAYRLKIIRKQAPLQSDAWTSWLALISFNVYLLMQPRCTKKKKKRKSEHFST